jgi:hypothetical protein
MNSEKKQEKKTVKKANDSYMKNNDYAKKIFFEANRILGRKI